MKVSEPKALHLIMGIRQNIINVRYLTISLTITITLYNMNNVKYMKTSLFLIILKIKNV